MRVWAALCCVAAAAVSAGGAPAGCNVSIGAENYKEESLVRDAGLVASAAVDYATDLLYFSYKKDQWFSAKLDLKTGVVDEIKELTGRCKFTVDQVFQQVHAGCLGEPDAHGVRLGAGLYQFDSNRNRFVLEGEATLSIEFVYYNEVLYYSDYTENLLHTFRKGHSARVPELPRDVLGLVIDKHKDMIFYNETGVYRQRVGAADATRNPGLQFARALAVDGRGEAHVCSWGGGAAAAVYRLHGQPPSATRLLDVRCFAFTFDRDDNIIYATDDRIVRLVKC